MDLPSEETRILLMNTDHHIRVLLHATVFSSCFSLPPLHGDFSTLYRLFLIIWILYLLIIWTSTWAAIPLDTHFSHLWVAAVKAVLFRSLLHINMARKVAVVHLKWWWQLFLRYFEFSSLSHVQGAHFNCLSIHLVWVCHVQGGVLPQTFFPLSPTDEACNVDHLSCVSLLELVSVLEQGPRPNTLFWALAPTIYLYIYIGK